MKKLLIHTDEKYSKEAIRQKSIHLDDLNDILLEYSKLSLPALTGQEFQTLIHDPKRLIFDKMNDGTQLTIAGMDIHKSKAIELVTFPPEVDNLAAMIASFRHNRPNWAQLLNFVDLADDQVVINQSVIDRDIEDGKTYLHTEEEQNLYHFLQAVIEAANKYFGDKPHHLGDLINKKIGFKLGPDKATYTILHKSLKGFGEV